MAVTLKKDEVYTDLHFGENQKGRYGFVNAKGERGSDKITVFFSNIDDIPKDTYAVQVTEIESVSVSAKQSNGTWFKNVSVNAKVQAVEGGAMPIDIEEGDVPF